MLGGLWPEAPGWGFVHLWWLEMSLCGKSWAGCCRITQGAPSPSTPHSNEADLGLGTGCPIFNRCPSGFWATAMFWLLASICLIHVNHCLGMNIWIFPLFTKWFFLGSNSRMVPNAEEPQCPTRQPFATHGLGAHEQWVVWTEMCPQG